MIHPDDVAEAAAAVLTTAGHAGKSYELSGPEALTTEQQVQQLGAITGRDLTYVNVPDDAARQAMVGMGMTPRYADAMVHLIQTLRGIGRIEPYPGDVKTLTGHDPRTFRQWAETNAKAFQ